MKYLIPVIAIATIMAAFYFHSTPKPEPVDALFTDFVTMYRKSYFSADEYSMRRDTFAANLAEAASLNDGAEYGVTPFSDLTAEEFSGLLGFLGESDKTNALHTVSSTDADLKATDWRDIMTPVKNQGQCGSCWAFSTMGSLEPRHFQKTGDKVVLSEQELVDCDTVDLGCKGGLMDDAFTFLEANNICYDSEYKNVNTKKEACLMENCADHAITVDHHVDVAKDDCAGLAEAVMEAPVSVAIDATLLQFYVGGVMKVCLKNLNHGVTAVGFNTDSSGKLTSWIVRNSWGSLWGKHGYFLLNHGNTCGICRQATYPVLA